MYGTHEMHKIPEGLMIKTTMKVTGLLSFLWIKLVAQKIVDTLGEQTHALVAKANLSETLSN